LPVAESNTRDQRAVDDDITNFLKTLIFPTFVGEISVTRISAAGETSPLEKNVLLF
jgi:hypothetical protein